MPRKHPVLGVPVMTTSEFFAHEAKAEGKGRSGIQVMEQLFAEMDADMRLEERHLMEDPAGFLLGVQQEFEDPENDYPPRYKPKEVLKMLAANVYYGIATANTTKTWALVRCVDGRKRTIYRYHMSSGGSYEEPPSEEDEIVFGAEARSSLQEFQAQERKAARGRAVSEVAEEPSQ